MQDQFFASHTCFRVIHGKLLALACVVLGTSYHGGYKNNFTLHSTDGATEYLQCITPDGSTIQHTTGVICKSSISLTFKPVYKV